MEEDEKEGIRVEEGIEEEEEDVFFLLLEKDEQCDDEYPLMEGIDVDILPLMEEVDQMDEIEEREEGAYLRRINYYPSITNSYASKK